MPWLKNEIRFISLLFIMFFLSKKHNWESLALIYMMTLGYSFLLTACLEEMIYNGWLEVPMIILPSLDIVLRILQITDQGGSWINMMSKFLLFPKIRSVRSLFFQTFSKKIFRFFIIIDSSCPQLSKLICLYFHRVFDTSLNTILYWNNIYRKSMCCC